MKCTLHFLSILALLTLASKKSKAHESFEHHLRNLAVEKIDCQIASVAIDYYGEKPPDHEMRCTRLNSDECFDIEFDPNVHPGQGKPRYPTGTIVTFRGSPGFVNPGRCRKLVVTGVDRVDLPEGFSRRNGGRALQHPDQIGVRSAMMMIVRFTDAQGVLVGTLASDASRKTYAQTAAYKLFGTKNRTHTTAGDATHADTWWECSYEKLRLNHDTDNALSPGFSGDFPADASDVFYVDVPLQCTVNSGFCTSTYDLTTACGPAEYYGFPEYAFAYLTATVPGFTRSTWQHWVVVFDISSNVCNFVGMANANCDSSYCYSWIPHTYANQAQDYTHELGHNINLAHSGFDSLTGKIGNELEYGDLSAAMGYCCTVRCYNAPHAYELGWLQPSLELNDSNLTPGTVLPNVVLQSMSMSATGAITLTGSWSGGRKFWLQYKTAHTFDKYMFFTWRNNVQIKVWSGTNTYEKTGDLNVKLIAGQSWSFGGVTVTVQSLNPSQNPPYALLTIKRSCSSTADCDDGNFCNGAETCSSGTCTAGQSPCGGAQCDETNNVCFCQTHAECNDGLYCTGTESCAAGSCQSTGNPCPGSAVCNESTDTCSGACSGWRVLCSSSDQCCSRNCARGKCTKP